MQKQSAHIITIIIIILYLPYLHNTKNLLTAVIARRRGDPGSHRAYERANVRLGQFRNYLSKTFCIFVLKPGRFDERVTETGREIQSLGPW